MTRFQELAEQVRDEIRVRSATLDGELVSLDEEGRQIFRRMLAGRGHLHQAAYDLLWLNGKDLRRQPLTRRKRRLERRAYTQAEGRWELFQER
jgi:bifunctional non-homologous end joining protein LigD